ncbi:nucleic-acid-binding protein from mobile element [Plakobranchus ocellatus]|uniref:Nucleic-acid-binding protein from mobile element n=1 Tax=Plakobranchus ocellatus TaxID=259542 RepID=A0AAV3Z1U4_9GAST|nr:nucleic-acid-binding protein from mobile element [Plakobranchus ocellatus]
MLDPERQGLSLFAASLWWTNSHHCSLIASSCGKLLVTTCGLCLNTIFWLDFMLLGGKDGGGPEWRHSRSAHQVASGEDKIQTDTIVLIFDSLKPPSRIRAGYLTLHVRPYVPIPMRCYKCQRYGHGKDRCKKPAAVCVRCGKGGHVERDCSADPPQRSIAAILAQSARAEPVT